MLLLIFSVYFVLSLVSTSSSESDYLGALIGVIFLRTGPVLWHTKLGWFLEACSFRVALSKRVGHLFVSFGRVYLLLCPVMSRRLGRVGRFVTNITSETCLFGLHGPLRTCGGFLPVFPISTSSRNSWADSDSLINRPVPLLPTFKDQSRSFLVDILVFVSSNTRDEHFTRGELIEYTCFLGLSIEETNIFRITLDAILI